MQYYAKEFPFEMIGAASSRLNSAEYTTAELTMLDIF